MGGLVENIDSFYDPLNKISTIKQVAPHWLEASSRHGMPVDIRVFDNIEADFKSTYPANIAYKAAQFQDSELAGKFLRRLREAAAAENQAIHKKETLVKLAGEVGLDTKQFETDFSSGKAREAFMADLHEARSQGISGFPTFILRNRKGQQILLHGYRPFSIFLQVIDKLVDKPLVKKDLPNLDGFIAQYNKVATQEIVEVFGLNKTDAEKRLIELAEKGKITRLPVGNGDFWKAKDK
jgi:predicted DsbA family dithiol-disulfide isomerase